MTILTFFCSFRHFARILIMNDLEFNMSRFLYEL